MEGAFNQEIYEFAVCSPRAHLVKYLVFFFVCDLLLIAVLFFCLILASGFPFVRPDPDPSLVIAIQIFMFSAALPVLFLVVFLSSFTLFTMRRLISHKPALLITHQGINVQDLPAIGNTFLSWSEIASICVVSVYQSHSKPINHLCFNPKNPVQFLSLFHPLQRFLIRVGSVATGTLIPVPQWFLSEPAEEVLLQIRENFQEKLQMHEVQLHGAHS